MSSSYRVPGTALSRHNAGPHFSAGVINRKGRRTIRGDGGGGLWMQRGLCYSRYFDRQGGGRAEGVLRGGWKLVEAVWVRG